MLHSLFHQLLDCLVILTCFEFALHAFLILEASVLVTTSSLLLSDKSPTLILLIACETLLIKLSFSLLFFAMENFDETMFSSVIEIVTVRGAWSEERYQYGLIEWLLSSVELHCKNMRSMTEFASPVMSEYLVGIQWVGINRSKLKESARIIRLSLIAEWWGKDRSQILSLILKSLVIINKFVMFTLVSLRYFKVEWEESE